MKAHAGDRIVVESERVTQPPRTGVVEEVIAEDPALLRVLWDDGHTTLFAPGGRSRPDRRARADELAAA